MPHFTQEELDTYCNAVANDGLWEIFCGQIHIPGDKDGQMMSALLTLPQNPHYRWAFERDDSHVTEYEKGFELISKNNVTLQDFVSFSTL